MGARPYHPLVVGHGTAVAGTGITGTGDPGIQVLGRFIDLGTFRIVDKSHMTPY